MQVMKILSIKESDSVVPILTINDGQCATIITSYNNHYNGNLITRIDGHIIDLSCGDFITDFNLTNMTIKILPRGTVLTLEI